MVICFLHDSIVKVVKIQLSLVRYLVVRVQEVECKGRLWTKHRRWEPANTEKLAKVFQESAFRTLAKTNANSVMT